MFVIFESLNMYTNLSINVSICFVLFFTICIPNLNPLLVLSINKWYEADHTDKEEQGYGCTYCKCENYDFSLS